MQSEYSRESRQHASDHGVAGAMNRVSVSGQAVSPCHERRRDAMGFGPGCRSVVGFFAAEFHSSLKLRGFRRRGQGENSAFSTVLFKVAWLHSQSTIVDGFI